MRRAHGFFHTLLLLAAASLLAGCEPCSGVLSCGEGPHVSYLGEVVDPATNQRVPGVVVTFQRTGGIALAQDSVRASTAPDGQFWLSVQAAEEGVVTGRLHLSNLPHGRPIHTQVSLQTIRLRRDARVLPRLFSVPYLDLTWNVHRRADLAVVAAAPFEFRSTGSVPVHPEVIRGTTNEYGHVRLRVTADSIGYLEGTLRIDAQNGQVFTVSIREPLELFDRGAAYAGPIFVGPWLGFAGRIVRASGEPIGNAEVVLRRTAGVATETLEVRVTTDPEGYFGYGSMVVLEEGILELEVTVRPPGGGEYVISGVEVPASTREDYYFFGDLVADG
jgi:hypothetical protein